MKKLFALLFVLTVLFTACGQEQPVSSETLFLSREAEAQLDSLVCSATAEDLLNAQTLSHFEDEGIFVTLKNIEKTDNDSLSFTLLLEREDVSMEINAQGILGYRYFTENEKIIDAKIYWGSLSLWQNEIIYTSLNSIEIWSADSFEKLEKTFDFSFLPGNTRYLADTVKTSDGYTIGYYAPGEQGIALLNTDGSFREKHTFIQKDPYIYFGTSADSADGVVYNRDFRLTQRNFLSYLDSRQTKLGIFNKDEEIRDGYLYDFETDTVQRVDLIMSHEEGDTGCFLLAVTAISAYPMDSHETEYMAIRAKKHIVQDSFVFDGAGLDYAFGYNENTGRRDLLSCSATGDIDTLSAYCPRTRQTLKLDFVNKTAVVTGGATAGERETLAKSQDGEYSLLKETDSKGSAKIYLCEKAGGKLKELCGAENDIQCGFYENNERWVLTNHAFRVFSPDMTDGRLEFAFYGGTDFSNSVKERVLLYAIRDSYTKNYTILYADIPYTSAGESLYISGNSLQIKATYKIMTVDSDALPVVRCDTGVNAVYTSMGFVPARIEQETADKLLMSVYDLRYDRNREEYYEHILISGRVDIATGEYTEIQPFIWDEI